MLRKLVFNRRTIPVPVPIRNLGEAMSWLSGTLIKPGEEVTRVVLDGIDLLTEDGQLASLLDTKLHGDSRLDIIAESPAELAVQTTDALRNLAMVIERGLKSLAVTSWQTPPTQRIRETESVDADLVLMRDMCEHVAVLIPSDIDVTVLKYLVGRMDLVRQRLSPAASKGEWQTYARLLLNQLEPALREVATETENVQTQLYSRISHMAMSRNQISGAAIEGQ